MRTAFVAPQGGFDRPGEQFFIDLIWFCASPGDRIEHIRVVAGQAGFDVVWFLLSEDAEAAAATVMSVSRRVIEATPVLAGWIAR